MKKETGTASDAKNAERRNPPVVSVDFDGTVCLTKLKKKYTTKTTIIGQPNWDLIKMLCGMKREGWKIVINSSRWWGDYNSVKNWLDNAGVPYDDIVLGAFKADLYINDKNLCVDTYKTFEEMTNEKIKS